MFLSYEPVGDRVREDCRDKYQNDAAAPKKGAWYWKAWNEQAVSCGIHFMQI